VLKGMYILTEVPQYPQGNNWQCTEKRYRNRQEAHPLVDFEKVCFQTPSRGSEWKVKCGSEVTPFDFFIIFAEDEKKTQKRLGCRPHRHLCFADWSSLLVICVRSSGDSGGGSGLESAWARTEMGIENKKNCSQRSIDDGLFVDINGHGPPAN